MRKGNGTRWVRGTASCSSAAAGVAIDPWQTRRKRTRSYTRGGDAPGRVVRVDTTIMLIACRRRFRRWRCSYSCTSGVACCHDGDCRCLPCAVHALHRSPQAQCRPAMALAHATRPRIVMATPRPHPMPEVPHCSPMIIVVVFFSCETIIVVDYGLVKTRNFCLVFYLAS